MLGARFMQGKGGRSGLVVTAGAVVSVVVVGAMAGCQDPLFPDRAPRSQYERYESLRGEAAPRYEPRQGPGPRQPALRERLAPRDGV